MIARIKIRRDVSNNWENVNSVLGLGEFGVDTTVNKFKIGDGTTPWNSLNYFSRNIEETEQFENNTNNHIARLDERIDTVENNISIFETNTNNNFTNNNLEDKIDTEVLRLDGRIDDVDTDLSSFKTATDNSIANIADINLDITEIKTNIADINLDITEIKDSIENIDIVSIKGSVGTFSDLPNPNDFIPGSAFIVGEDENRNEVTTVYMVIDNGSEKEWEFIAEFKVDLSNFYDKAEIDNKLTGNYYNKQEIDNKIEAIGDDIENIDLTDYSLVEQDTGQKWIDGKTIYQKTISIPSTSFSGSLAAGATSGTIDTISNVERLIRAEVSAHSKNPSGPEISKKYISAITVNINDNGALNIANTGSASIFTPYGNNYITIWYTKG